MRIQMLFLGLLFTIRLWGQDDKINELISEGVKLHDQGKYNEAIGKYKSALEINNESALANYELSFSYFLVKQYDSAIKYSSIVIKHNTGNQHESYIVLGNSFDLTGQPGKAVKTYEEGLKKYPNSNLLHYNLALTCYNQKEYKTAENAAINAVTVRPEHGSSHIILSAIMQESGQRIKSILPLYYFLMLEPDSRRSSANYTNLRKQLEQGVEKKDDKNININLLMSSSKKDDEFSAAEMMISLLAASKYTGENEKKNDLELFTKTNQGIFSVLGELKKDNKGFWWDLYVTKLYDLVQSENIEAFSYFISQSTGSEIVTKWIIEHAKEMKNLEEWMNK